MQELLYQMQQDPSSLSPDKQRMIAEKLRGMRNLGAMGSTSQIDEVSRSANRLSSEAVDIGRQMGVNQSKEAYRKQLADQEERRVAERREEGRLNRALRKTLAKEAAKSKRGGSSSTKDSKPWRATAKERKAMMSMRGEYDVISGMLSSFEDEFANPDGLGFAERMVQRGMTSESPLTSALMNSPLAKTVGVEKTAKELEKEQRWWGAYERLSKIPERARIFGATLTANEQASWDKADINEGMTASQIKENLKIRSQIAANLLRRQEQAYTSLGMPKEFTDAQTKGLPPYRPFGEVMSESVGDSPSQPTSTPVPQPEGLDIDGWEALSPEEQQEFLLLQSEGYAP